MSSDSNPSVPEPFANTPEDERALASGWSAKHNLVNLDVSNERGDGIGSVSDLIVGGPGNALYAIVAVGGFLGLGKREVAIPVRHFHFRHGSLILPGASEEALKALPRFEYPETDWETYDFASNAPNAAFSNVRFIQRTNDHPNRDPLSGATGAHPLGTGIGAAGGAVSGAAVGVAGGPVGAAVGAVVGAVIGGLAGKGAAEALNPTKEDEYWRVTYVREPYYSSDFTYEDYGPAYRAGYQSRAEGHTSWESASNAWEHRWETEHAQSRLSWRDAEPAAKAAWERANQQYVQQTGY